MLETFVHTVFGLSLFTNALCFIPQAVKIVKSKDARSVSLLTYLGFNLGQIFSMWHAYYTKDFIFMGGTAITFVTCSAVTALILYYRKGKK